MQRHFLVFRPYAAFPNFGLAEVAFERKHSGDIKIVSLKFQNDQDQQHNLTDWNNLPRTVEAYYSKIVQSLCGNAAVNCMSS